MFNRLYSAVIISGVIFTVSATVSGKAFASMAAFSPESAKSSVPATVNTEPLILAQKRSRSGGARSRPSGGKASSKSRSKPSTRPSGGSPRAKPGTKPSTRPSGGSPGAKPGTKPSTRPSVGNPGSKPGSKPSTPSKPSGGNKNVNVNVNRSTNVTVRNRGHGWRGSRWGAVVFGVTLGTAIVVAANTPPPPPDPTLCWTWVNDAMTSGYWYYCEGP